MKTFRPRIGLIGFGTIGRAVFDAFHHDNDAEFAFVLDRPGTAVPDGVPADLFVSDIEAALARPVDVVVEMAVADVLTQHAARILARADLCGFSCTALADAETERAIRAACAAHGRRFFVPHGAILALDGLSDGRDAIESVSVTTTKSGPSLGLKADASGVQFSGSTRSACARFPRNVNVHAAVALAGLGFDRTRSSIVAVPGQKTMEHHIEVRGAGLSWDIRVASQSLGGVTGAYTPRSAVGALRRILGGTGITIA